MDSSQIRKASKTSRTSRTSKADGVHSGVRVVANVSTSQGSMAETAATEVGVLKTREGHSDLEWQRIVDAIGDPIGVVTTDYQLVYANAAYLALLEAGGERIGHHFCFQSVRSPSHDGLRESDGPCADCPLPQTVRTKQTGFVQQEWLPSPASTEPSAVASGAAPLNRRVYQRWTYPVLARDSTAVDYVVEVVKDVTEQEQMRPAAAHAEAFHQADQLKAELLGTVSDELRNPLAVIKGYTATLLRHERRLEQEERDEFLHAIDGACDRLEVMVDQLLEMSQLETGTLVPKFMLVNLEQLVREAGNALLDRLAKGRFQQQQVALALAVQDTIPLVQADPRLLRDALDSVLENALYYSPAGGTIQVTMQVAHQSLADPSLPGELIISVQDTGIGIPVEHLDRIFDRFHRVDNGLTREVNGLGLGLAICKRIVELHSGRIWGESELGEGSTFYLSLPLAAPAELAT